MPRFVEGDLPVAPAFVTQIDVEPPRYKAPFGGLGLHTRPANTSICLHPRLSDHGPLPSVGEYTKQNKIMITNGYESRIVITRRRLAWVHQTRENSPALCFPRGGESPQKCGHLYANGGVDQYRRFRGICKSKGVIQSLWLEKNMRRVKRPHFGGIRD